MKNRATRTGFFIVLSIFFGIAILKAIGCDIYFIDGNSMNPALQHGDIILIKAIKHGDIIPKLTPMLKPSDSCLFSRDDILVFQNPRNYMSILIKRCIGLPGDTIFFNTNVNQIKIANHILPMSYNENESNSNNLKRYLIVPFRGMEILLTQENVLAYGRIIQENEKIIITKVGDSYFIGDSIAINYEFKDNYYYLVGDNLKHSFDSRAFGPTSESLVVGKMISRISCLNQTDPQR